MDYADLTNAIFQSFWRCNEMSAKDAMDYAELAVIQIKKHIEMKERVASIFEALKHPLPFDSYVMDYTENNNLGAE